MLLTNALRVCNVIINSFLFSSSLFVGISPIPYCSHSHTIALIIMETVASWCAVPTFSIMTHWHSCVLSVILSNHNSQPIFQLTFSPIHLYKQFNPWITNKSFCSTASAVCNNLPGELCIHSHPSNAMATTGLPQAWKIFERPGNSLKVREVQNLKNLGLVSPWKNLGSGKLWKNPGI